MERKRERRRGRRKGGKEDEGSDPLKRNAKEKAPAV